MTRRGGEPNPFTTYCRYGGERPDVDTLQQLDQAFSLRSSAEAMLAQADVRIDLAKTLPAEATTHITKSRELLDGALDMLHSTDRQRGPNTAALCVRAYLRQAEISTWERAAQDIPIDHNYEGRLYEELLNQAEHAAEFIRLEPDAKIAAMAFVPVLLGARWSHRLSMEAVERQTDRLLVPMGLGRLALYRERFQPSTTNWHVGFNTDLTHADFDRPKIKLAVTARVHEHKWTRAQVGVGIISAQDIQALGDPERIFWSCIAEFEAEPNTEPNFPLLNSAALDRLTMTIAEHSQPHP